MFAQRRLKKARSEASSWLKIARRDLQVRAELFPPAERSAIEKKLAALETLLHGDDSIRLEQELRDCKKMVDRHLPFHRTSFVREYVEVIVVALVLALFIRTFIVQAFKIPSGSMIPTLLVGDHILVNKFIFGIPVPFTNKKIPLTKPKRGNIIVFKFPGDPSKDYIKRVIGIPGDRVEVRGTDVVVNGQVLGKIVKGAFRMEEPPGYEHTSDLYEETIDTVKHAVLYDKTSIRLGDTIKTVPEGQYFCMGDNRDHSNDSRYWGFVPEENIKGKAMVIYFSWPPGQFLRIGKLLR